MNTGGARGVGLAALALLTVAGSAGLAAAGTIGPANNGDFSFGDLTNWVMTQSGGEDTFQYEDVGAPHLGTLRSKATTATTYGDRAWHTSKADVGFDGSVEFRINSLYTGGGTFGVCFLGDPVYNGGGIPVVNNNDYKRGYLVEFGLGYGTFSANLWRKPSGWSATKLTSWSMPYAQLTAGWHTVTIHDDAGNIVVELDGQLILQVAEGASYLPTGYPANYAGGAYWGVFDSGNPNWADVNFDNLFVGDTPEAVTDLAAAAADWFAVDLTWTAPTDFPPGPVASYDIRYATSPIDAGNWASATQVDGEPAGATPGQAQSFTVTGLQAATTYSFAMKAIDSGGNASALSNVASATTGPLDAVAPAAVSDLAGGDIRASRVTLSWTATGDDGVSRRASHYDIRYSAAPIDEGNWSGATQADGEPAPRDAGTPETFILRGLQPLTPYYVAVKVGDEVPNWSGLSNAVSFTTIEADPYPPEPITDLRLTGTHIRTAFLTWTAPADVGNTGTGTYDVRYLTSPIDEGNWDAASQAAGEPVPAAPGTRETFSVSGLDPDTTYHFAVKTADQAEPANVSALSNVVSGKTMPPVAPVTIRNPWIVNDRAADCRTLATIAATFDKAYAPDGAVAPTTTEQRVINSYNNFKRRVYHWGQQPPNNRDTVLQLNVFGWTLCGSHAAMNSTILNQMGIHTRTIAIASGGHTIWEAEYDGKYHCLDTMTTYYVYNRANPRNVASMAEVKADKNLVLNAKAEGRACPGFLLCGDTPEYFANGSDSWTVVGDPGTAPTTHSMNADIRMGEAVKRTWESWANQYCPTSSDPPYHHEASRDWNDTVNFLYWEPYAYDSFANSQAGINYSVTYRRWANGTVVLAPDFRSAGHQASLLSSTNIATYNDDGLTPDLHVATPGAPAEAVFKITAPFYITDATVEGTFFRNDAGDVNKVYVSNNGTGWVQAWENTNTGTTQLGPLSLRSTVYGQYAFWVKIALTATGAKTEAGVSSLKITGVFEHNKGGMPYLDKGLNTITVTLDNPEDLATGAAFKVTYKWKEYDGAGWTIDRIHEQYVTASPTTFPISVGGTKVPRTEYILMEVTEPPIPDGSAPAPVTDLAVTGTDSTRVDLAWTASGDDWDAGQAAAYDIRYSMSPVTAANFDAATAAANPPAPKPAGQAETFGVTGLASSTLYYFALKVRDEGGNWSEMSNVVAGTTLPPDVTPPEAITDLRAQAGVASGSIQISWTAPGDDGAAGTAASYEIRYSANPITAANFASAALATSIPVPQSAGSPQSLLVTGLTWGQRYYFAIRTSDEVPNVSGLSNVAHCKASALGEKVLQVGAAGYTGCRDNYMEASAPAVNYGDRERMRICGYEDSGPTNRQRGLIRFDLSSILPGTAITSAKVYLYAYDQASHRGGVGVGSYGLYRLTRDWSESGSCWNNAATGTPWTTPGSDFEPTVDAAQPNQGVANVWYELNVTGRVQGWINGIQPNYGWCIRAPNEMAHIQDLFYASDSANAAYRPKLVISDAVVPLEGDVDDDGDVDVFDVIDVVIAFGSVPGDANWVPGCDLDGMGIVDVLDVWGVIGNFGAVG